MAKKKERKKKVTPKLNTAYTKEGEGLKRTKRFCPKCGPGIFMAKHKNRETCGKCAYTEFSGKEKEKK